VHVFNAYTFEPLTKLKHNGAKALDIVFAEHDHAVALICSDGFVGKWRIPGFAPIVASEITDWNTKAVDFVKHPKEVNIKEQDQFSIVLVGAKSNENSSHQRIRVLDRNNTEVRD
jgi:hypothetical protein